LNESADLAAMAAEAATSTRNHVETAEQSIQTEEILDNERTSPKHYSEAEVIAPSAEARMAAVKEEEAKYSLSVMDLHGNESKTLGVTEYDREREDMIKKYYDYKLEQVSSQVSLVDSRAVRLYNAYKQSLNKLKKIHAERTTVHAELQAAEGNYKAVKDDLDLTRKNYEQQMTLFTEHITEQSEKISSQETEIFSLKSMLKGRGK
ncbi:hypothetical protein PROFUN_13306, partial [Planoprotostelium fungivorum]